MATILWTVTPWLVWAVCHSAVAACPAGCLCQDAYEDFSCGPFQVSAELGADAFVTIECDQFSDEIEWRKLPAIPLFENNATVRAELRHCPLPGGALLAELQRFGAGDLRALYLTNYTGALAHAHFAGLRNLRTLVLGHLNNLTLPTDVFALTPDLTELRIKHSTLKLNPRDFSSLTKLKFLEMLLTNITELPPEVFRGLDNLETMHLHLNKLNAIDSVFEDLTSLRTLDLSENNISKISVDAFSPMRQLKLLYLSDNAIEQLPAGLFSDLKNLEVVQINENKVKLNLGAKVFSDLLNLKNVSLSNSHIADLPEDLLWGSLKLQHLDVSRNELELLPTRLLQGLAHVRVLHLSNNRLRTLAPEHFVSVPRLTELYLDNNQLQTLPGRVFRGAPALRRFSATHNQLVDVADDAFYGDTPLEFLSLAHNQLAFDKGLAEFGFSPFQSLVRLRTLELDHNRVARLYSDWRWAMVQLERLSLSHNYITALTGDDLQFVQENITVDVQNNNITQVSPGLALEPGLHLLLAGNPLQCDCRLYSYVTQAAGVDPAAACAAPANLAGRALAGLPPQALTCDYHACPDHCTCTLRPASDTLELACNRVPEHFPTPEETNLNLTYLQMLVAPERLVLPAYVKRLNLSNLGLTSHPSLDNVTLDLLDMTGNNLTSVSDLFRLNVTQFLLSGNAFPCDCSSYAAVVGLQENAYRITDMAQVKCAGGAVAAAVDAEQLCRMRSVLWAGATLVVVALALAALLYRYREWLLVRLYASGLWPARIEERLDRDKQYDIFVSFAHEDDELVMKLLVPQLEKRGLKVCVHSRDWPLGQVITDNIQLSVASSRRTLLVISPHYAASDWAAEEFRVALHQQSEDWCARLVAVLLPGDMESWQLPAELRRYLAATTYLQWGDPAFWDRLLLAVPPRRKPRAPAALELLPGLKGDALK